jgi:hypothetical protein
MRNKRKHTLLSICLSLHNLELSPDPAIDRTIVAELKRIVLEASLSSKPLRPFVPTLPDATSLTKHAPPGPRPAPRTYWHEDAAR